MFFSEKPVVRGALCALMAFVVWSCGDALVKGGGGAGIPALTFLATSATTVVLFVSIGLFLRKGNLAALKPQRTKFQLFRASLYPLGAYAVWTTFTSMPLTTVYIGLFLCPLLISLIGVVMFRESLSLFRLIAILIGFAGIIVSFTPDITAGTPVKGDTLWGYIALIVFIVKFVTDMIFFRILGRTETIESLTILPFLLYLPILIPLGLTQTPAGFDWSQLLFPVGTGISAGIGTLLIAEAYKLAPVSIVSPFHYSQLLTGAALGFVFWHDIPTTWAVGGSVLIVSSGLMIAREARNHKEPSVCTVRDTNQLAECERSENIAVL